MSRLLLGDRVVHLGRRWVAWPGGEVTLTELEATLLRFLSARSGPVSREELLREVWGAAEGIRSRTVDTTVRRLRKKIEADPVRPNFLLTVYGVGYQLAVVPVAPTREPPPSFAALGPFDLTELVGRGASGEVWAATHRRSGTPVAVKVMNGRHLADRSAVVSVLREARAAASLDHPNIVRLLDLGDVSGRAARATGYADGTPWLAMERAAGSLHPLRGRLTWPELRGVLLQSLDALAHAHARGVIHLDVKPGNLLVGCGVDAGSARTAGLRLSDFGIARAADDRDRKTIAGTPHYMAPEQIRRAWRDLGPWTDLFALGATAWALLTGKPPFDEHSTRAVLTRGWRPLPTLQPAMAIPEGLEGWLERMLDRRPYQRFTRAAEAAQALEALGPATRPATGAAEAAPSEAPTELFSDLPGAGAQPAPHTTRSIHPEAITREPRWWRPEPPPTTLQLADVGLALLPLRAPPFVGRDAERGLLWDALLTTRREGSAVTVEITGPGGVGLTRLAHWLTERAHETGIAQVIVCGAEDTGAGLALTLRRWLRCEDLSPEALRERVRRFLARNGSRQAELPGLIAAALEGRAGDAAPRLLARLLEVAGARRTVLLIVDDAHRSPEALAVARNLALRGLGRVCTVLVVPDDEVLVGRVLTELEALRRLAEHRRCQTPPLAASEVLTLVRRTLALTPALAAQITALAAGNPGAALQRVLDYASRSQLVVTPHGFALAAPSAEPISASEPGSIWLARALAHEAGDPRPLELAAALGRRFPPEVWRALVGDGAEALGRRFLEAGLFAATGRLYTLTGALWSALAERSRQGGRWADHQSACAAWYAQRDQPVMLGNHLHAAGQSRQAIEGLLAAGNARLDQSRLPDAWAAFEAAQRIATAAGLPASDPLRGATALLRVRALDTQGSSRAAHQAAGALEAEARANGWDAVVGEALRLSGRALLMHPDPALGAEALRASRAWFASQDQPLRAQAALTSLAQHLSYRSEPEQAAALAEQAVIEARTLGDLEARIRGEMAASMALQLSHRADEGLRRAREALALATSAAQPLWIARCRLRLLDALQAAGEAEEAHAVATACLETARATASLSDIGRLLNTLGDLERAAGASERARRYYQRTMEMADLTPGHLPWFARLNLALLVLEDGNDARAVSLARPAMTRGVDRRHLPLELAARVVLLTGAAGLGDWPAYAEHAARARALDAKLRSREVDIARCWERAREACLRADRTAEAIEAAEEVLTLARRRGDRAAAAVARERLSQVRQSGEPQGV